MNNRIPVIVISGFLGSGKTTFLRYLLRESNKKFGLIINEFGDVGIDGDLVKSCNGCDDSDEGCIIIQPSSESSQPLQLLTKSPSIPTSPNSLIINPNFLLLSLSKYLKKVVFPDPRNPEITITGILLFINVF